jgi:hypothetical protein
MEIQVLDDPKEVQAETQAVALRAKVDALNVVDQASYDLANAINKKAKEAKVAFHAWFDPIDESSLDARQAVIDQRKKIDDPLDYAYSKTSSKAGEYIAAQKAKAAEEQRKAEEIARKAAEDAALATAQALQDEGLKAQAEAVLEAPVVIQRVEVAAPAMDSGTSLRTYYSAELKGGEAGHDASLLELAKSVVEGRAPIKAIMENSSYLNKWAVLTKGTEAIPGVEVKIEHKQSRTL